MLIIDSKPPLCQSDGALTLHAASWGHARLEILRVRTGHAQVKLCLQHPLPHPAAFVARGAAARRPGRPGRVDARLGSVV